MRTSRRSVVMALLLASFDGVQCFGFEDVDFRNFAYPFQVDEAKRVPDRLAWMSLKVKGTVALVNGRYDFTKDERGPSLILSSVHYGYLTSSKQLDAVVVLHYHTGGTAYWQYLYAFSLQSDSPKLVGWFRTGSRADGGLYRIFVSNRDLTVDLYDRERRVADCCSKGFVRTTYDFKNEYFIQRGLQEFGDVEQVRAR